MSEQKKYSTHVLELIRNNGVFHEKKDDDSSISRTFLMFDYFDVLLYKKLDEKDKDYINYFSIGDTFNDDADYKVSYKTLSLYCHTEAENINPFLLERENGGGEVPFLGLIQISLCNENFTKEKCESNSIDKFLRKCEDEILDMVEQADAVKKDPLLVKQLYRSSTTGDFCLAVRTDLVETIYGIALALSDSQSNPDKSLKVLTYTNVGIECRIGSDNRYETLGKDFVNKNRHMCFALRFSADLELMAILKKYQSSKKGVELEIFENFKGLLGRYDYLLRVSMEEFANVYPVLCEKKIGFLGQEEEGYDENMAELKDILRYPQIRNINERVLVELNGLGIDRTTKKEKQNDYLEEVLTKNRKIFYQIRALKKRWKPYFSEEERAFRDLFRGMEQIYKTYSALGMEKEAYINWLMFCQDIDILCECINRCMEKYEEYSREEEWDERQRRVYRSRLLKDWRISIQAVNQYTRLVQNINYQTYQSPIYELQTQIDTEKVIVAYREAMRSFINCYIKNKPDGTDGTDDRADIIPMIYPDLSKDKVEVTAPFTGKKKGKSWVKREIICMVPSFEYFGRLYDLLPWILHESSHHLRILLRERRNKFLIEYVFSYIFRIVAEASLPKLSNDKWYISAGKAEQILIDKMKEETEKDFKKLEGFEDFGFERILSEIDRYLKKMFPYGAGYAGRQYVHNAQEIRNEIYSFYLNEYREEGILTDKNLNDFAQLKKTEKADQEKPAEELLKIYWVRICKDAIDEEGETIAVQLKDLYYRRGRFEEILLKVNERLLKKKVPEEAVKEYCFKLANLYRVFHVYDKIGLAETENEVGDYLDRVFESCLKSRETALDKKEQILMSDPGVMYVQRSLGLLNKDKETFKSKMMGIFGDVDFKEIQQYKNDRIKVYRETFADLLMTTALDINSFGYCRQVLQTISDARVDENEYQYDDINYMRFRIVTAVLLWDECRLVQGEKQADMESYEEAGIIILNGSSIIKNAEVYCEATLKCIHEKLAEMEEIANNKELREQAELFVGNINGQMQYYLQGLGESSAYASTLLYVLLHGEKNADEEILEVWQDYKEFDRICEPIKYLFWRLECFCLGLERIMQNGHVAVEKDIFEHMKEIRKQIKKDNKKGCIWEEDWDCLLEPKMDVGEFYNRPELVFEKKTQQKLETTIDFVQNYYYYNRFKMMEEVKESGGQWDSDKDQVCRESAGDLSAY